MEGTISVLRCSFLEIQDQDTGHHRMQGMEGQKAMLRLWKMEAWFSRMLVFSRDF